MPPARGRALVGRRGGPRPVPTPPTTCVLRGRGRTRSVRPGGGPVPALRAHGAGRGGRLDHRDHQLPARHPVVRLAVRAAHSRAACGARRVTDRHGGSQPWWAPPHRLDARPAHVLGLLAAASLTTGFVQHAVHARRSTFAADEFGAQRRGAGRRRRRRAGAASSSPSSCSPSPTASGGGGCSSVAAVAAPLLAAVGALAPSLRGPRPPRRRSAGRSPSRSAARGRDRGRRGDAAGKPRPTR